MQRTFLKQITVYVIPFRPIELHPCWDSIPSIPSMAMDNPSYRWFAPGQPWNRVSARLATADPWLFLSPWRSHGSASVKVLILGTSPLTVWAFFHCFQLMKISKSKLGPVRVTHELIFFQNTNHLMGSPWPLTTGPSIKCNGVLVRAERIPFMIDFNNALYLTNHPCALDIGRVAMIVYDHDSHSKILTRSSQDLGNAGMIRFTGTPPSQTDVTLPF